MKNISLLFLSILTCSLCAQTAPLKLKGDSVIKAPHVFIDDGLPAGTGNGPTDSTLFFVQTAEEQKITQMYNTRGSDTTLDNLHNYYQMGVLGNTGLPSYSLLAGNNSYADNGFFRWMNPNNANDLFNSKQPVYFYPVGKVYTKLFAAVGQKQEQVFKILHSQNIGRVNVSLQFNRYSCLGFYTNQKSLTDNLIFSSHARTKKGRAGYKFYFVFNKLKYQLNGGIDTSKKHFENYILAEKQLLPVNLSSAKQNIRTSEADLDFFLKLSHDSMRGHIHQLEYEVNYQGNYWLYTESMADTARYTNNYFASASGINTDSISFRRFSNTFLYKYKNHLPDDRWNSRITIYAGYKNEFNHYHQYSVDTMSMNHIAMAGAKFYLDGPTLLANAQYVLNGINTGNFMWNAKLVPYPGYDTKFYLKVDVQGSKLKPAFMNTYYDAPHFAWSNSFSDIMTAQGTIELGSRRYRFSLGAYTQLQRNSIYFDTLALPKQYSGNISLVRGYANKDLKLGPIHFNNTLNYQVTSSTDIIRLPQYYTTHQLYYEGKLFKKALWLQFGVQARYISSFKANAYMPATNQFYLQNEKEYGNYVFVDVFLNAQIERFRFFILASHINQGLSGANYMLCPNYPMPDRSLKAGLCWMFFD